MLEIITGHMKTKLDKGLSVKFLKPMISLKKINHNQFVQLKF